MKTRASLVLSCEHASSSVPSRWAANFRGQAARAALASHRGWDPGALPVARHLARELRAPLVASRVSRLVIDANRSPGHPRLFSEFTRHLGLEERRALQARYHTPHREAVRRLIEELSRRGPVLHLAIHSFTPIWEGEPRSTDIGLLHDPSRRPERSWASELKRELSAEGAWTVHKNAPYRGVADGLPTTLRRLFSPAKYAGFEIELNQRLLEGPSLRRIARALAKSVSRLLDIDQRNRN